MTIQIAVVAGAVVGFFAWLGLPKLRALLRLVPAAALVLTCVLMFARLDLPPYSLTFAVGAGAVIGLFSLARG